MVRIYAITALLFCMCFTQWSFAQEKVLQFGVVPQQAASRLAHLWGPLLDRISKETGIKLIFATAPNIPEFEKRLAAGQYDIAYMNPYHYMLFSKDPGYRAIAHEADTKLRGIIVVRHDSKLVNISELNGQKLAFPSPAAFAASVLPRAALAKTQTEFETVYVSSHDSVYRAVAQGIFVAGGGIERTFDNLSPEIKSQLRVLWTTEGFTPHAIAVNPRLSDDESNAIRAQLTNLAQTEEGRKILSELAMKGFQAAEDKEWDDVRALGIQLLKEPEAQR